MARILEHRASGILLHPSSLPGPHGSGDLGPEAFAFVDFLKATAHAYWQMLPIHPLGLGNSPYSALSAFAGNALFISPDTLVRDGFLRRAELGSPLSARSVDYARTTRHRLGLLRRAFARFKQHPPRHADELAAFRRKSRVWLTDYALFMALRAAQGARPWLAWDEELRTRQPAALRRARRALVEDVAYYEFEQWLFDRQWRELQRYAHKRGVRLIGDIPIFVSHDSADVWSRQHAFQLDRLGQPRFVSGVPPDYFSADGQRWGTPLYDWQRLKSDGYDFWIQRFGSLLDRFELVRLDHFIGFVRYWQIPQAAPSAKQGRWKHGPGRALFDATAQKLGTLRFIAEDLGSVTPEVEALRDELGLPGMRVLQFAFGSGADNPFLPHNYVRHCVAYTGTHDNDTTLGFLREAASPEQLRAIRSYLGLGVRAGHEDLCDALVRALYASVAQLCVIPIQDALRLGNEARMNFPGRAHGNWTFRLRANALRGRVSERLAALSEQYGRAARAT